jgi:hypothetical protein
VSDEAFLGEFVVLEVILDDNGQFIYARKQSVTSRTQVAPWKASR